MEYPGVPSAKQMIPHTRLAKTAVPQLHPYITLATLLDYYSVHSKLLRIDLYLHRRPRDVGVAVTSPARIERFPAVR